MCHGARHGTSRGTANCSSTKATRHSCTANAPLYTVSSMLSNMGLHWALFASRSVCACHRRSVPAPNCSCSASLGNVTMGRLVQRVRTVGASRLHSVHNGRNQARSGGAAPEMGGGGQASSLHVQSQAGTQQQQRCTCRSQLATGAQCNSFQPLQTTGPLCRAARSLRPAGPHSALSVLLGQVTLTRGSHHPGINSRLQYLTDLVVFHHSR